MADLMGLPHAPYIDLIVAVVTAILGWLTRGQVEARKHRKHTRLVIDRESEDSDRSGGVG